MVYRGGLENRFGLTANGGSNPSLSASFSGREGKQMGVERRKIDFFVNSLIPVIVWGVVIAVAFGFLWWKGYITRLNIYFRETWNELKPGRCSWPTWIEFARLDRSDFCYDCNARRICFRT